MNLSRAVLGSSLAVPRGGWGRVPAVPWTPHRSDCKLAQKGGIYWSVAGAVGFVLVENQSGLLTELGRGDRVGGDSRHCFLFCFPAQKVE